MSIQQWWQAGRRFLFQTPCPLCSRSTTTSLCQDCRQQLYACERTYPFQDWQGDLPLMAWGSYEGVLKQAITNLKYQNQPQVAEPLGLWLGELWQRNQSQAVRFSQSQLVVVPIPLHCDRKQERGYNQAELIAQHFCRVTGLHLQTALLSRERATAPQFALSLRDRQANLFRAFRVNVAIAKKISGAQILLLDDIYTTGATAQAAVQVLQAVSCSVLGIVTVARTERNSP